MEATTNQELLTKLAELTLKVGCNLQPGQTIGIGGQIGGHEPLVREIARQAYVMGAEFVDVSWFDPLIKLSRLQLAAEHTLSVVPPWLGNRIVQLGEKHSANVSLVGQVHPGIFADVDPKRVGLDQLPALRETGAVINRKEVNWTVIPAPNAGWAALVHPDLEPADALRKLEHEIAFVCRLDADDPAQAWRERSDELQMRAAAIDQRRFDAIKLVGPGTDLTVGLLPSSRFAAASLETCFGVTHQANLPTEEVFTTPDPLRVNGQVTATKPLTLGGATVDGIQVEFKDGVAIRIDATQGVDVLRNWVERDEGAKRLGELALVDGDGRVGQTGTVFHETLLDENAASHIAFGSAYLECVADKADHHRANRSAIHVDFMIGSEQVKTFGLDDQGNETVVLAEGKWQI